MSRLACVALSLSVLWSCVCVHALRRDVSQAVAIMENTGAAAMYRQNDSFVMRPPVMTWLGDRIYALFQTAQPDPITETSIEEAQESINRGFKKTADKLVELIGTEETFNRQLILLCTLATDLLDDIDTIELRADILLHLKKHPRKNNNKPLKNSPEKMRALEASDEWQTYKVWLSNIRTIKEASDKLLQLIRWRATEKQVNWSEEAYTRTAIDAFRVIAWTVEKSKASYCTYLADLPYFNDFFGTRLEKLPEAQGWIEKWMEYNNLNANQFKSLWILAAQRIPRYVLYLGEIVDAFVKDAGGVPDLSKPPPDFPSIAIEAYSAKGRIQEVISDVNDFIKDGAKVSHNMLQRELVQLSRAHKAGARTDRETTAGKRNSRKLNILEKGREIRFSCSVEVRSKKDPQQMKPRTLYVCNDALFFVKAGNFGKKVAPEIIRYKMIEKSEIATDKKLGEVLKITVKSQQGAEEKETVFRIPPASGVKLGTVLEQIELQKAAVRKRWRTAISKVKSRPKTSEDEVLARA